MNKEIIQNQTIENKLISKHLYFLEPSLLKLSNRQFKGINLKSHNAKGTRLILPHKKY